MYERGLPGMWCCHSIEDFSNLRSLASSSLHNHRLACRCDPERRDKVMNLVSIPIIMLIGGICFAFPRNEFRPSQFLDRLAPRKQIPPDAIPLVRPQFTHSCDSIIHVFLIVFVVVRPWIYSMTNLVLNSL